MWCGLRICDTFSRRTWRCLAAILREALLVEVVFYLQVSPLWSAPFCLISRLEPLATSCVECVYCVAHKWEGGEKKVKILFKSMCACVLLEAQLSGKCVCSSVCLCVRVCVCVRTPAIGAARYRSMQPHSVSVLLSSLESFVPSRLSFSLLPLWIHPPHCSGWCVYACVCVCARVEAKGGSNF